MRYVVWVRCDFRTDMGWDYIWNEYSGIKHYFYENAEKEMKKAELSGYYAIIKDTDGYVVTGHKEAEYDEV